MHKIRVALPHLPLLLLLAAAPALAGDFRNADWGMSQEQVKASEWLPLQEEDSLGLIYRGTLFGEPTDVTYLFADDKLVRAQYDNVAEHGSKRRLLRYYDTLAECVTQSHGVPVMDETFSTSLEMRDNPDVWLTDPEAGKFGRYMYWDTDKTHALAILFDRGSGVDCFIDFYSIEFGYLQTEHNNQELQEWQTAVRGLEAKLRKAKAELQDRGEFGQQHIELFEDQLRILTRLKQLLEERNAKQARAAP